MTLVPVVLLVIYLARHGDQTLTQLSSGRHVRLLLGLAGLGAAAYRYRKPLLDAIDRRFFREQYDARRILTLLVDRIRSVHEVSSLANLVSQEIDLALHLEGPSWCCSRASGVLSTSRPQPAGSMPPPSGAHGADGGRRLDVDPDDPHSPKRVQEPERRWLAAAASA